MQVCLRDESFLHNFTFHLFGQTFLIHFYLLKGEEPPICISCDQLCSGEHLLTECVDLIERRRQFL